MKKILISALIGGLALSVVGCSNASAKNVLDTSDSNPTESQFSKTWQSGVPKQFKGYYGRNTEAYGEKTFEPLTFQNDEMSYGLGDKMILKPVEYKQVGNDIFIIHGQSSQYDTNNSDYYVKVLFNKKNNKMRLGMVTSEDNSNAISSFEKTRELSTSNVTWYSQYSKAEFDKLAGNTTTSSSDTSTQSKSLNKSSTTDGVLPMANSEYSGKIFWSKGSPLYIVFGSTGDDGNSESNFSSYNVHDNGSAYQSSYINNAEVVTKGNKITVRDVDGSGSKGSLNQDQSFIKLSSSQLQRTDTKEIYTLYDGSVDDLTNQIISDLGLQTN